jgi:hypothetical protein
MFAAAALALLSAGCATVQVAGTPEPATESRNATIAEAAELARNDAALAGQAKADNARRISRLLGTLDDATLAREAEAMAAEDPLYNFIGRALLARGLPLPKPFARGDWRFDAASRPPAERDGYRPPVRLAVLLPLSGSLATAAQPVRDGFLAGYYGETRRRPEVSFIDTAPGVAAAYDRAVAEGNDFVVGPLGRDEVGALFGRGALPVPVLALNRSGRPPAGSASFSLSPEDEGIAIAGMLVERNARRVLVVGGNEEGQRRAIGAFRDAFIERGGTIVDTLGEGTADFSALAQKEGGIDAVFLAMKGASARLVAPRLAAAGLGGKLRVATSQLASGTGKAGGDRALDGIVYPTEAWGVRGVPGLPPASSTGASLPTARGAAARLFAFGHDAWRVTAYLEHLATARNAELQGATGTLRLDGFGNVLRTPAWATFSAGAPMPLADGR